MSNKVFVGNFDFSITDVDLAEFFSSVGEVVSAKVMNDINTQKSRGFGFVEFEEQDSVQKAIDEYNGKEWKNRVIKVCEERKKKPNDSDLGVGDQQSQVGYFKAQPLDIGVKRTRRPDVFNVTEGLKIDYKDVGTLKNFLSERGKYMPRRVTGLTALHQRHVATAVKRAQHLALLPYVVE